MRFMTLLVSLLILPQVYADEPEKKFDLHSWLVAPGLPLSTDSKYGMYYGFHVAGQWQSSTEGSGTLHLDPNPPVYDEFGYASQTTELPMVKLALTLKFVKKGKVTVNVDGRIGGQEKEIEWSLFEVKGPKITSKLYLALKPDERWLSGRLLVHDDQGKVKQAVDVHTEGPPQPCHPGCFPAGTKVAVGGEMKAIETIKVGDSISTFSKDWKPGLGKITSIFVTKNRLIEVRMEKRTLVTTETQPLSLVNGELKAAGELRKGDTIIQIVAGIRVQVNVTSVEKTNRFETVYNLVLGEPTLFIANGFLARSKPPEAVEASK